MSYRTQPIAAIIATALIGAALLAEPGSAKATPTCTFTVDFPIAEQSVPTESPCPVASQQLQVSRGPISHPYGTEIGTSHARAEAGYGFVKGLSAVTIENGGTIVAQESSNFSLDNIRISGPSGTAAGTIVNYSLNIGINGGLDVGATTDYAGTATVQLNYSSGSSLGGGGAQLGSASYSSVNGFTANGVFAGLTAGNLNANLTGVTPTRQARANDLITVSLLLSTTALAGHINFQPNPAGSAFATSFFADTVMFPTAGPVFNFDLAGWTANSDDGCIVNNQYLCAPAAAAVPEPATFLIVLWGLGALICHVRRIHRA